MGKWESERKVKAGPNREGAVSKATVTHANEDVHWDGKIGK